MNNFNIMTNDINNNTSQKTIKVLVVGCGPSGLVALKELREVAATTDNTKIDVVAVDSRDEIGGVFSPNSNVTYEDLHLTISNMFMAFSDFPPKVGEGVKYWSKQEYYEYLVDYTSHFNLMPYLKLKTKVKRRIYCIFGQWSCVFGHF